MAKAKSAGAQEQKAVQAAAAALAQAQEKLAAKENKTNLAAVEKAKEQLKEANRALKKALKEPGKIEQIISLHEQGLTNAEIVEKGFNKTTVNIQVAKYKKANA